MIEALDIRVRGIVQGVGFRPFVYRQARRYIITGWVLNDLDGVFIHAEGETKLLDEFVTELHMNPPAAAKVTEVELREVPLQDCTTFEIRESQVDDAEEGTFVSADLATCDDCLRELFDPADRRYRYPFINCTNCGPRFTIIDALPYDRPQTSMASFEMCDTCAAEYSDPANRRFHAQPDACFACGPQVTWEALSDRAAVLKGPAREEDGLGASDAVFAAAVETLAQGGIVAVKGLGGFHLVCDAENGQALADLRARKHRDGKAFAVMVPDADAARESCDVSPEEAALLATPARPIVLLEKREGKTFAPGLADGLPELGVMLPATPVQHLLMHDYRAATGKNMLVMTSGNIHDEPIVIDDAEAREKFVGIADAVLGNDRPILSRYDDSVMRVVHLGGKNEQGEPNDAVQMIRRARGYAPVPLSLGDERSPAVFAAGPEQKNTFTFSAGGSAYVSQHIGDMEDADVYDAWLECKRRFEKLFAVQPSVIACDLHPEYLASKWAREHASDAIAPGAPVAAAPAAVAPAVAPAADLSGHAAVADLPLVEVQHHHAHVASVLGEHGLFGPAIGIAFDGTGYGPDGAIWGGEVLLANQADYERFANFAYAPMPGGAAAIKKPLRMAYGLLWAYDLLDHEGAQAALAALGREGDVCAQMIEAGLNTPHTSSVGRLFDAVAALTGVCASPTYEGEAAIMLDAVRADGVVGEGDRERYRPLITKNSATETSTAHDTSVVLIDVESTLRAVLEDMVAGVGVPEISLRFHDAIVDVAVQVAQLVRAMYDMNLVVLSGGCFMNRYLVEQSSRRLGEAGFTVALGANLPPNDGCISYGQAVVASASR